MIYHHHIFSKNLFIEFFQKTAIAFPSILGVRSMPGETAGNWYLVGDGSHTFRIISVLFPEIIEHLPLLQRLKTASLFIWIRWIEGKCSVDSSKYG